VYGEAKIIDLYQILVAFPYHYIHELVVLWICGGEPESEEMKTGSGGCGLERHPTKWMRRSCSYRDYVRVHMQFYQSTLALTSPYAKRIKTVDLHSIFK
jgi:hypothetical protein